jgi:hypothetical protein
MNHESDTTPPPDRELHRAGVDIESNCGRQIATLADWQHLAPPASAHHWREYRSPFELAGGGAARLRELLAARAEFADLRFERPIAERKSRTRR